MKIFSKFLKYFLLPWKHTAFLRPDTGGVSDVDISFRIPNSSIFAEAIAEFIVEAVVFAVADVGCTKVVDDVFTTSLTSLAFAEIFTFGTFGWG